MTKFEITNLRSVPDTLGKLKDFYKIRDLWPNIVDITGPEQGPVYLTIELVPFENTSAQLFEGDHMMRDLCNPNRILSKHDLKMRESLRENVSSVWMDEFENERLQIPGEQKPLPAPVDSIPSDVIFSTSGQLSRITALNACIHLYKDKKSFVIDDDDLAFVLKHLINDMSMPEITIDFRYLPSPGGSLRRVVTRDCLARIRSEIGPTLL